ncbi:unnamed protein product [Meloidogyne enterolobii]|uniref:Uncharacterized protein n=1 Tax=Meloidogyne enterolobii TaxID=390850 RepID=A0ACB0Y6G6_MELEN
MNFKQFLTRRKRADDRSSGCFGNENSGDGFCQGKYNCLIAWIIITLGIIATIVVLILKWWKAHH